jgi:hypothetical protein
VAVRAVAAPATTELLVRVVAAPVLAAATTVASDVLVGPPSPGLWSSCAEFLMKHRIYSMCLAIALRARAVTIYRDAQGVKRRFIARSAFSPWVDSVE